MKYNKAYVLLILVILVLGIFYFKSQKMGGMQNSQVNNQEQKQTNTVEIKNYAFSPQSIKVKKGTTVTWTNSDLVAHTVTKSDGSKEGPDSELIGKDKKYSYTFSKTGTFSYYCKPHPYMKGTVQVVN